METVTKLISKSPVFVFSKTYCPYCLRAKQALNSIGVKFDVMELNKYWYFVIINSIPNGSAIQDALLQLTGKSTVPNIFVKGKSIGGCILYKCYFINSWRVCWKSK